MLSCTIPIFAQTKNSTKTLKSDTIIDYTHWTYKGFAGFIPIHMQPGFNGLLNYGVGFHFALSLPAWLTIRGKAIIDLYEQDRALWDTKGYDNSSSVHRGYWFEGGLDINFLDKLKKTSKTYIAKTGKFDKLNSAQELYGKYYERNVFMNRFAFRTGFAQYQFVHANNNLYIVDNVSVAGFYGGFSYSKIGLGKPFLLTIFADALFKSKLSSTLNLNGMYNKTALIGYRAGCILGINSWGGVGEIGMAPGLDNLELYVKAGLTFNFNLLSAQKLIRKKIEPEIDKNNETQE
jgi:hypothetical protein